MDPRVIGNVHRPGLSSTGKAGSAGAIQRIGSRAGAEGAIAEADRQAAVLVALELLSLPGCQRPHICSEGDVKHGFGGDMQRSSGAPLPRCPTSAFRRCLACC